MLRGRPIYGRVRAALPFLDFSPNPHLLFKQADITNATNFHKPFLFQLKTDLDLPSELAATAAEGGERFRERRERGSCALPHPHSLTS